MSMSLSQWSQPNERLRGHAKETLLSRRRFDCTTLSQRMMLGVHISMTGLISGLWCQSEWWSFLLEKPGLYTSSQDCIRIQQLRNIKFIRDSPYLRSVHSITVLTKSTLVYHFCINRPTKWTVTRMDSTDRVTLNCAQLLASCPELVLWLIRARTLFSPLRMVRNYCLTWLWIPHLSPPLRTIVFDRHSQF